MIVDRDRARRIEDGVWQLARVLAHWPALSLVGRVTSPGSTPSYTVVLTTVIEGDVRTHARAPLM